MKIKQYANILLKKLLPKISPPFIDNSTNNRDKDEPFQNSNNDSKLNIPNYPLELLENKYLDDCGRMPILIISLSGLEQSEDVENIISKSLKNIKINK
jgi:hypothetical protein